MASLPDTALGCCRPQSSCMTENAASTPSYPTRPRTICLYACNPPIRTNSLTTAGTSEVGTSSLYQAGLLYSSISTQS